MKQVETRTIFNRLKASAKKRGIPFELTLTDLNELSYPLRCPILDIPLKYNTGQPGPDSYSIDRINSDLGYVKGNIVVISYKANRMKSDGTLSELQSLTEFYENLIV